MIRASLWAKKWTDCAAASCSVVMVILASVNLSCVIRACTVSKSQLQRGRTTSLITLNFASRRIMFTSISMSELALLKTLPMGIRSSIILLTVMQNQFIVIVSEVELPPLCILLLAVDLLTVKTNFFKQSIG